MEWGKNMQQFHYQTILLKGRSATRIKLYGRLSLQQLAYFQFNFMNWLMWHRVPSCYCLQDMFIQVHLEEFLFCSALQTTTKASNILEKVSSFFESENLLWDHVCWWCTDGALVMLGIKSGFQVCVKKRAPKVKVIHCMNNHKALTSKTLLAPLGKVLDQTIQIVNFVKEGALTSTHYFSSSYVLTWMQAIICFFSTQILMAFKRKSLWARIWT